MTDVLLITYASSYTVNLELERLLTTDLGISRPFGSQVIRSLGVAECSWVELVASGPQRPHTFISHSWKDPRFSQTLRSSGLESGTVLELFPRSVHRLSAAVQEFFRDFMSTVYNLEMERGLTAS